jgi:hypothetical protein
MTSPCNPENSKPAMGYMQYLKSEEFTWNLLLPIWRLSGLEG